MKVELEPLLPTMEQVRSEKIKYQNDASSIIYGSIHQQIGKSFEDGMNRALNIIHERVVTQKQPVKPLEVFWSEYTYRKPESPKKQVRVKVYINSEDKLTKVGHFESERKSEYEYNILHLLDTAGICYKSLMLVEL